MSMRIPDNNAFGPRYCLCDETKVDIMIRWDDAGGTAGEYNVLVDGVSKAEDQRFGIASNNTGAGDVDGQGGGGGGVERVGLYVLGEGRAWFDEIYLGPDFTMGERGQTAAFMRFRRGSRAARTSSECPRPQLHFQGWVDCTCTVPEKSSAELEKQKRDWLPLCPRALNERSPIPLRARSS